MDKSICFAITDGTQHNLFLGKVANKRMAHHNKEAMQLVSLLSRYIGDVQQDCVLLLIVHLEGGGVLDHLHHEALDLCVPLTCHGAN